VREAARLDDVAACWRLDELTADLQVHGAGDDVDALIPVRVGVRRDEFAGASSPSWMLVVPTSTPAEYEHRYHKGTPPAG